MNLEAYKEHIRKKTGGELFDLKDTSKTIQMLEKRVSELEEALKKASGWHNKEVIRQSLKTNNELLEQARKEFWKDC